MNTHKTMLYFAMMVFSLLTLTACGGGGGGDNSDTADASSDSSPEVTPASPDGIWHGTFTEAGTTYDLNAIVYDNYLYAYSTSGNTLYEGKVFLSGENLSGTINVYQINGGFVGTNTVSGTVVTGKSISGRTQDNTTFSLTYDNDYERASSLNTVSGIWSITEGNYTETITIQADGTLDGSNTNGCAYTGSVSVPDSKINVYKIVITASLCGIYNGTYTGLGSLDDLNSTNDVFAFAISSSGYVSIGGLLRQ